MVLRLIDKLGLEDEVKAALREREGHRIVHWTDLDRKMAKAKLEELAGQRGKR